MKQCYPSILMFVLFLLVSCSEPAVKNVKKVAREAEWAEVCFFPEKEPVDIEKSEKIRVTDPQKISELGNFISVKSSPLYKCGYDGAIRFMKKDRELLRVDFNLSPACRHTYFMIDDIAYSQKLTEEGRLYLKELYPDTNR